MKKVILVLVFALTGCEALPYAFNAAGFGVTQYLSGRRQSEIMAKMAEYDAKLVRQDLMLGALCQKFEIDTGALGLPPVPSKPIDPTIPVSGAAGAALMGLLWAGLRYAAKSKGVDLPDKFDTGKLAEIVKDKAGGKI